MRKRASIEMASGLLGHQSVATTKSYRADFEDESVKKVTGNLLDAINVNIKVNFSNGAALVRRPTFAKDKKKANDVHKRKFTQPLSAAL
ncbi:hypothetical protein [Nafulsella turpanensis]|uniref:hypothetical protein n=1 Tax=Nafulsella turpanensis TaxID=1265690 RepID=UPI000344E43E|nr:hypothetical protein [Nafulsella turpanensis]